MRARSRSLGHAMKRGETALIRSIRHSTDDSRERKRKVRVGSLAGSSARRGGSSAASPWLATVSRRLESALGGRQRRLWEVVAGGSKTRFFLAIEKLGPYSESSFECKREIFSSSGDVNGVAGEVR